MADATAAPAEAAAPTLESLAASIGQIMEFINKMKPLEQAEHPEAQLDGDVAVKTEEAPAEASTDADEEAEAEDADKMEGCDAKLVKVIKTMDAKITKLQKALSNGQDQSLTIKLIHKDISKRDALVKQASPVIGAFDSANMTSDDAAQYIVKKLGLDCKAGQEESALAGYFAARKPNAVVSFDNKPKTSAVDNYLSAGV